MTQPWYVESFKEDYLKIYAHRTDEAAAFEVEQILNMLDLRAGQRILDLCCGNGRHSRHLHKLGFAVTGIDLSLVLLEEAQKKTEADEIRYIQSDVRNLPFQTEFDAVLNLFTSFGYFEQQEENMKVFDSISQALKENGQFLVDFLNPPYVRQHLVPYSEREAEGLLIREQRRIEKHVVIKNIEVVDGDDTRHYEERVHLFEYEQMKHMLEKAGLTIHNVYGDFEGHPYEPSSSPRMIITGKK